MRKEKLVKVRAESELRVGMIVVEVDCECGAVHRGIILSLEPAEFMDDTFGLHAEIVPRPSCMNDDDRNGFAIDKCITEGRLYRVIDGLERDTETTKDREMERVR